MNNEFTASSARGAGSSRTSPASPRNRSPSSSQLGSIEEGKLADLAVLNRDYFKVPDEDLKRIRSILTVVDGEVVYDRGVLHFEGDRGHERDRDRYWGRDDD